MGVSMYSHVVNQSEATAMNGPVCAIAFDMLNLILFETGDENVHDVNETTF